MGFTGTKRIINSVSRVADDEMICQERFIIKSNLHFFFKYGVFFSMDRLLLLFFFMHIIFIGLV